MIIGGGVVEVAGAKVGDGGGVVEVAGAKVGDGGGVVEVAGAKVGDGGEAEILGHLGHFINSPNVDICSDGPEGGTVEWK